MKKITLLSILTFTVITSVYSQVKQTPMIEHFTQASCPPCSSQNPTLKATLDNFGEANYVRVTHQNSWPGVDPMNAEFPSGPEARRLYYSVSGIPNTSLNGAATGTPNTIITNSSLTTASNVMTPYNITVTQSWANENEVTVNIDVDNVTDTAISSADKIYVTMLERQITFTSPPGATNETLFEDVMRQMYNASTGDSDATSGASLGEIPGMSTTNFNFTITNLPSYLRDKSQVIFAVYIQNNSSKQILQASKSNTNTLSTNDFFTENSIKIFPNPSSDFIKISRLTKNEGYRIYNVLGAEIKNGIIPNNKQIDIRDFTNGLYFLKFENGNNLQFIKE